MSQKLSKHTIYIAFALIVLASIILLSGCTPSPCKELKGIEKEQCIAKYAISNSSADSCNKINDKNIKEYCISEIAIASNDLAICDLTLNQTRDACYTKIAEARKDISICDNMINGLWEDACLKRLSIILNDTSRCPEITDIKVHDDCITELMPSRMDINLCTKIIDSETMHRCVKDVALFRSDPSACYKIQDGFFRDSQCIKKLAQKSGKKEICDMAITIPIRINCYEKVLNITLVDGKRQLTNLHLIKKFGLKIPLDNLKISPEEMEEINK